MSNRRQGFRRFRRPSSSTFSGSTLEIESNKFREERPLSELHPDLSIYDELPVFNATPNTQINDESWNGSKKYQYSPSNRSDASKQKSTNSPRKRGYQNYLANDSVDNDFVVCTFPSGDLDVNIKPSQVPTFRLIPTAMHSTTSTVNIPNPYLIEIGYHPYFNEKGESTNTYYQFVSHEKELLDDRAADSTQAIFHGFNQFVRVEYDMDKCDYEFLRGVNKKRTSSLIKLGAVSKEAFEVTMTLLEIAWFSLEQRMPARKKSKFTDEIPDSEDQKCVICDDGECDNNNAIVFCDGCDIGVHQDCYGVPFIPEGQWLCRACEVSRTKMVDCAFCPNKSGVFKKTNTGEWAHLICSIWIPETRITDPIFIEPVTGLELIDKNRWKLVCYICKKRMGACIQCSSKKCPQAYHPTCGRKARLYMKMNNGIQGALLDQSSVVSYCDKHTPSDHNPKIDVRQTVRIAKEYYRNHIGPARIDGSATNGSAGINEVSTHDHQAFADQSLSSGMDSPVQPWKTKGGIPVIPAYISRRVETALEKFCIADCYSFVNQASRYWALKREHRKGAYLLKRLQNCSPNEIDLNIDYKYAKEKLMDLKSKLRSLDRLKEYAENMRRIELNKLKISEQTEDMILNQRFSFMKSVKLIWAKFCKADQQLASRHQKGKNAIPILTSSPDALEIDQKIQDNAFRDIAEFKADLLKLIDSSSQPAYSYFTDSATAKFRSVGELMVEKVEVEEQSSLDIFIPGLPLLLPIPNTALEVSSNKSEEVPEPVQPTPALLPVDDEAYDYQVNYRVSSARKRKRLVDDDI